MMDNLGKGVRTLSNWISSLMHLAAYVKMEAAESGYFLASYPGRLLMSYVQQFRGETDWHE